MLLLIAWGAVFKVKAHGLVRERGVAAQMRAAKQAPVSRFWDS